MFEYIIKKRTQFAEIVAVCHIDSPLLSGEGGTNSCDVFLTILMANSSVLWHIDGTWGGNYAVGLIWDGKESAKYRRRCEECNDEKVFCPYVRKFMPKRCT